MVKLQVSNNQYTISIPKDKIILMGLQKGDLISLDYDARTSQLVLTKVRR